MKIKRWLLFSLSTTLAWGIWGAVMEFPERFGFPVTLGYTTWALMMIPCALVLMARGGWQLEWQVKPALIGLCAGLLGAGGQLLLFSALKRGPAYLIFPIISLSPVLTVLLATAFLRERAGRKGWLGVGIALVAICLLSYQKPQGDAGVEATWLIFSILILIMWGVQAFVMKLAHGSMRADNVFFYMMLSAVALVPVALVMTDFSVPINWGLRGPLLSAAIQVLNAVGALSLVYALRHGKAIVVAPVTALAPVVTTILSLIIYGVMPHGFVVGGMMLAVGAILLLSRERDFGKG